MTWVETKNQLGLIETSLKTLKDSKVSSLDLVLFVDLIQVIYMDGVIAVYVDSLVMISIEKSETNKKRALEI